MSMSYIGEEGRFTIRWLDKEDDTKMSTASKVNVYIEVKIDADPSTTLDSALDKLLGAVAKKEGVDREALDMPMILETNPVFWYNEVMELKGN